MPQISLLDLFESSTRKFYQGVLLERPIDRSQLAVWLPIGMAIYSGSLVNRYSPPLQQRKSRSIQSPKSCWRSFRKCSPLITPLFNGKLEIMAANLAEDARCTTVICSPQFPFEPAFVIAASAQHFGGLQLVTYNVSYNFINFFMDCYGL